MHDPPEAGERPRATLFVMVGLPGAGKTTVARELESTVGALRLTPDEWMRPLFGDAEADGKRDVVEGRFVWLAMRALRLGVNVILDFGCWSRDERSALRALAGDVGARSEIVYVDVGASEQRHRLAGRATVGWGDAFEISAEDLERSRAVFEAPDHTEIDGEDVAQPPTGYPSWKAWASARWPTSMA